MVLYRLATAGLFALLPVWSFAAENDFFDPIEIDLDNVTETNDSDSAFDQKGFVLQKFKYGLSEPLTEFAFDRDQAGLSQAQTDWYQQFSGAFSARTSWQLGFKTEVDWMQWRDGEQEWQTNHERLFLKDAFVDMVFDNGTWIRAGHQIFAWSQSQSLLAITDVLSPVDLREPGQAELEDIREQVPAVMVSVPVFDAKLSTVVTYDAGHHRYADKDEEFYPYVTLERYGLGVELREPDKEWELAVKLDYQFNGGDFSLVAADINDNDPAFQRLSQDFSTAIFTQQRVRMVAVAANKVRDSWLFKAELGRFWDQPVANVANQAWREFDQLRGTLGVEYNGWNNWFIDLEVSNIYLSDFDAQSAIAGEDESSLGYLFMVRNTAMNDRLENQFWAMKLVGSESRIYRWDLTYDLSDRWEAGAAVVAYEADNRESTLYPFKNHDSVNFSVEYHY